MKSLLKRLSLSHGGRGQSLVELAISLTVMLLLLAGAVTFGMALFSYVAIRDAAQEGALFGSFNPIVDGTSPGTVDGAYDGEPLAYVDICNRVKAASDSPVNMTGFGCTNDGNPYHAGNNIDVTATTGNPCEGTTTVASVDTPNGVQVAVEYNYPIIMPYIGGIIGSQTIHLRATVTDTILEPRCP